MALIVKTKVVVNQRVALPPLNKYSKWHVIKLIETQLFIYIATINKY